MPVSVSELPVVVPTADGSNTLWSPRFRQHYHSVHGALTESRHVFIESPQLRKRMQQAPHFSILEVGLGTGLNFLLAAQLAEQLGTTLSYVAVENHPPPDVLLRELDYGSLLNCRELADALYRSLESAHSASPRPIERVSQAVDLSLFDSVASALSHIDARIDAVFLDGFSPDVNPELWTYELFAALRNQLADDGTLSSYCVAGTVRRALEEAQFSVQRLPGPPGKREILLARKSQPTLR